MSSIHTQGSKPNYFCAFYDPEGFRKFRTTGTSNRRIAAKICSTMERAARLARDGKLSSEKALKIIRETCAEIEESEGKLPADAAHGVLKSSLEEFVKLAGGELQHYTVRSWLESWLTNRKDASKATLIEYHRIVKLFLKHLGARSDRSLTTLQSIHIEKFRDELQKRVAPSTVNKAVKILKASFTKAVEKRQLEFSPAAHVEYISVEESNRRPFTMDEIKKLLAAASEEWRTMILEGYYTGMRLSDCASLTWRKVDLHEGVITKTTKKTKRPVSIPIHETLAAHLGKLAGDDPDAPLCPTLHGKSSSWLSGQFHNLMSDAGLVAAREGKQSTGKGRDARRDTSRISFHSLRYNTTSALKNAGVNDSVAMDIVGHETEAMSQNYTKISDKAKREAINSLPDITK